MQESVEKGLEKEILEKVNPLQLEETPSFEKDQFNALFEQLSQSIESFQTKLREGKGTKKPWHVFGEAKQAFLREHPLVVEEKEDQRRQTLLVEAILEAPRGLFEQEFKLAVFEEQKKQARNPKDRESIANQEKKVKEESASWQHRIAAFILIHRDNPEINIETHMRDFWQRLGALEEIVMPDVLRKSRKEQGETKSMAEAAREGIARVVTATDVLRDAGFMTYLPTAFYDREYGHDFYATPRGELPEGVQRPLYAFQIKPLKFDGKGPLYIEKANAESSSIAEERAEIYKVASGLRKLRNENTATIGKRKLGAVYVEVPVGPTWPGISPATGSADEAFRLPAARDLDKRLKIE